MVKQLIKNQEISNFDLTYNSKTKTITIQYR